MKVYFLLLISLPLFFISHNCQAQTTPQEEALQLFEKEKYAEALPVFKRMITLFPKDPRYQYYTGACLVQTNTDLKKALDYLKFAVDRDVPRDVYYFIGKANSYLYLFDDALSAFLKFQQFGDRTEKDRWQCDMQINMARCGKSLTEKQAILNIYKIDSVKTGNVFDYFNGIVKEGKFREKQEKSFSLGDSKTRSSWRFVPTLTGKTQPVFETSTTGINKKNRDIVISHHLTENEWSRSENPGNTINSAFDEDYAYFNVSESALYFSSKGHNSMGGYDIFKSIYNPDKKSWSDPINLGYPINTPYDDFLFVPSDDQVTATFASNRETHGGQVKIYTISFNKNYSFSEIPRSYNLTEKSWLRSILVKPAQTEKKLTQKTSKKTPVANNTPVPEKALAATQPYPDELLNQQEYNDLLNEAMRFQLQSDSMGRIAESLKQRADNSKSDMEKEKLKKEIFSLESRAKVVQLKADTYYEKARAIEKNAALNTPKHETSAKENKDLVKNALTHKPAQNTNATSSEKQKPEKQKIQVKPAHTAVRYEFKIMSKSPYATINDIPLNKPMPEGLLYKIQMGSFSKQVEPDRFKGIIPITGETIQNGAITKYYAGLFSKNSDAEKALNKIREMGFKDSFIVAFYNGKNIPSNRAKELEKENI